MKNKLEHIEQMAFVQRVRREYPDIIIYAVPNGGYRNAREGKNLKAEGVLTGVSDIVIHLDKKMLYIEMKRKRKILKNGKNSRENLASEDQISFLKAVTALPYVDGAVCYGRQEAWNFLQLHLFTLKL